MWIDVHNHLQDAALEPHLGEILKALRQSGVRHAVVNGTRESDWAGVQKLAAAHPWILPSYGLHPWFIRERAPDWQEKMLHFLDNTPCGIGEIGLDRWIEGYDLPDQQKVFRWQLALAAERNLPATIHCIRAWGSLVETLQSTPLPSRGFLIHSYGGPEEMIGLFSRLGAWFSFSGCFLHERKRERRELFSRIPLERILVETDAPAMPLPVERQTHSLEASLNHPAHIVPIYHALAEIRGMPVGELAGQIQANFQRLFLA